MSFNAKKKLRALSVWGCLIVMAIFTGCSSPEEFTEESFIGKWSSSKSSTPIYLYEVGEWEIVPNGGDILQYGVWQFTANQIMWSYVVDDRVQHDMNQIISTGPFEFKLREADGSITTFQRLE